MNNDIIFILYSTLQLSELEQRVIEAEERAEEAEDKVRVLPNGLADDSWKISEQISISPVCIWLGSCDGTEIDRMAIAAAAAEQ